MTRPSHSSSSVWCHSTRRPGRCCPEWSAGSRTQQCRAGGILPKAVRYQHRGLDRGDVERLSLERYKPGRRYWVTEREAARILGINRARVFQLRRADRLPFVEHHGRHYSVGGRSPIAGIECSPLKREPV